ncbi:MAG: recombinase family protein [Lachnospiraceae bacterium]
MDKIVVAMYLRLSREDDNKNGKEESNSITAQRELVKSHIETVMAGQPYSILEFCDDGYSGVGFERPGFKAMTEAARSGGINVIAVKDFSRFGRDYLEVGRYLEFIFPVMQVRFISVNDNYDSNNQAGATGGMGMALKNLVYSIYSRDLAKKVRTAQHTRVKNGEFIASFAPYGYRKDPEDPHKLLADAEVAWVVQKIFQMAADGTKVSEIARYLNEMEVPTKYLYHKAKGDNFPCIYSHTKIKLWDCSMISRTIKNQVYLGKLVWNQSKCGIDTGKKQVKQPEEEWIVYENHHQPLVTQEVFDKANRNIIPRNSSRKGIKQKNKMFFCGYCGKSLQCRSSRYSCRSCVQQKKNNCQNVSISEKNLHEAVTCQIRSMVSVLADKRKAIKKQGKYSRRAVLESIVSNNMKAISQWKDTKVNLYGQYKDGKITKEDYITEMEKGKAKLLELEQDKEEAQKELDAMMKTEAAEEIQEEELSGLSVLETFDKEKIQILVEKVFVYSSDAIEIVWKTSNPFG